MAKPDLLLLILASLYHNVLVDAQLRLQVWQPTTCTIVRRTSHSITTPSSQKATLFRWPVPEVRRQAAHAQAHMAWACILNREVRAGIPLRPCRRPSSPSTTVSTHQMILVVVIRLQAIQSMPVGCVSSLPVLHCKDPINLTAV